MLRRILAFLCLLLIACANGGAGFPPPNKCEGISQQTWLFHGSVKFSAQQRAWIDRAAEMWSEFSNGNQRVVVTYDLDFTDGDMLKHGNLIFPIEPDDEDLAKVERGGNFRILGVTSFPGEERRWVRLVNARMPQGQDYVGVTAHEFGHVLGLDHLPVSGQLLSAAHTPMQHNFTHLDLRWCVLHCLCPSATAD